MPNSEFDERLKKMADLIEADRREWQQRTEASDRELKQWREESREATKRHDEFLKSHEEFLKRHDEIMKRHDETLLDRKSTRLNSSHPSRSRMPSSA